VASTPSNRPAHHTALPSPVSQPYATCMAFIHRRLFRAFSRWATALLLLAGVACQEVPSPTPSPTATRLPEPSAEATVTPIASPTATSGPAPTPSPTPGPTQVEGVPRNQSLVLAGDEPTTLDPALSQDATSHEYVSFLFGGLVRLDNDLRLQPDLAASWETLDGGARYRFHLRTDARFSDGSPVTAQDIAYSLERATDPSRASPTAATYLGDILGVDDKLSGRAASISGLRVVDDLTLDIRIDAPKVYFLAKLSYPMAAVVSRQQVESDPAWSSHPIGTGPFRLKDWKPGQHLVLERQTGYYRPNVGVRYVVYLFNAGIPDRLYAKGGVDIAPIGADALPHVLDPQSGMGKDLRAYGELSVFYFGFNTRQPPFDDPQVRRAFAMALDVRKLMSAGLEQYLQQAGGFIPPGLPGYDPTSAGLPFDPVQARQLLAASRYGGPGGLPPLVFVSSALDQVDHDIGEAIAQWRDNLGVDISVRLIPHEDYFTRLTDEPGDLFDFGWIADYPDPENFLDVLFHTGAANNIGGYFNPNVDALVESARVERDPAKRFALYAKAQQALLQDAAAIPLRHGVNYVLVKPYVHDFALTALGLPTLEKVSVESKP